MRRPVDLFHDNVDDTNVHEMRLGQIGFVKGRLDSVRYGGAVPAPDAVTSPSLQIIFPDWGELFITLRDYATAKGLRVPLGARVTVAVQCISEDAEVMAIAIWEAGNPVPIPLGVPMDPLCDDEGCPRHGTPHICTTIPEQEP